MKQIFIPGDVKAMRIWYKEVKENRILKETVIENTEDISRTKKIFSSLENVCHTWDIAVPVWLDSTVKDFKYHAKARFYADAFPEEVDFDYLMIQVIEE